MSKKRLVVYILSVFSIVFVQFAPPSFAQVQQIPRYSQTVITRIMGTIRKSIILVGRPQFEIKTAVAGVRGFSSIVPKEKAAFKFGVLTADLLYAENSGNTALAEKAAALIIEGLKAAKIEVPAASKSSTQIQPLITKLIDKENVSLYYDMGEWAEAMRLAMILVQEGDMKVLQTLQENDIKTDYFLTAIKGKDFPPGIMEDLKGINDLFIKKKHGKKDIKQIIRHFDAIIEALS